MENPPSFNPLDVLKKDRRLTKLARKNKKGDYEYSSLVNSNKFIEQCNHRGVPDTS